VGDQFLFVQIKENVCRHLRTLELFVKRNLDEGEGLEILTHHYTHTDTYSSMW
jgi:hypothetical protein